MKNQESNGNIIRDDYIGLGLDQTPANLIQQFENQHLNGESFIASFSWSTRFKEYISEGVDTHKDGRESLWILRKGKNEYRIPMIENGRIVNPLSIIPQKKQSLKSKCRRLNILKKAYSGTDKLNPILEEIKEIERENEMAIDEILAQ